MRNPLPRTPRNLLPLAALACVVAAGCQQKMAVQPHYQPDEKCEFFADGTSSRPLVEGTVARGHLRVDRALFTGRLAEPARPLSPPESNSQNPTATEVLAAEAAQFEGFVEEFPIPVTRQVVEHGRDRYLIYCVLCHDAAGTGFGKIVERGFTRPPSYHIDRLRRAPPGYLFRVITNGYGSMPSHAAQIPPRDRWAIVAYVRALQLSQHFPAADLPDDMRRQWEAQSKVAGLKRGLP